MTWGRRFLATSCALALALGNADAAPQRGERPAGEAERAPAAKGADRGATRREREAKAHFQRGERAFSVGKFFEALESYEQAYQALPLPAFVFNIAQCHRHLGHHERAIFFYRRYLALEPRPSNEPLVQELIAEEQSRLEDERAAAEPPPPVLRAAALGLPPEAAAPAAAIPAPPAPSRLRRVTRNWWFWTAIGGAVAVGAAALLLGRDGGSSNSLGSVTVPPP